MAANQAHFGTVERPWAQQHRKRPSQCFHRVLPEMSIKAGIQGLFSADSSEICVWTWRGCVTILEQLNISSKKKVSCINDSAQPVRLWIRWMLAVRKLLTADLKAPDWQLWQLLYFSLLQRKADHKIHHSMACFHGHDPEEHLLTAVRCRSICMSL